ncbi:MAG: cysteine desulfurase family protein [Ignavibacteria bacterium]
MIYLDNSATTALDPDVLEQMLPYMRGGYGNASSIYALGRESRVAIERARTEFATLIGAHPAEIIFTSGGTEANNAILKSALIDSQLATSLLYSATEHHAVIHPAQALQEQGYDVRHVDVDTDGRIKLDMLPSMVGSGTLLSVMHANNETGVIQPLEQVRAAIGNALLHADAVQSLGKIPIDVRALPVDFLSFSAHKIHGPKGIGAMFIRKGINFAAHQQGGGQERNRRAGTEPVALIIGMVAAARAAVTDLERRAAHMQACINHARSLLAEHIDNIRINTPVLGSLPNIINVSFMDAARLDGESILQSMDIAGVAVSNGSACVSGSLQPSHVLKAMGRSDAESKAAVRISVSKDTTFEEIDRACALLSAIIRNMRV